jgi:hypothetical protein
MTDNQTKPTPTPDDTDVAGDDVAALRKEAAKHRTKAREAETERDRLAERLQAAHRTEVARLAGEHLADGSDIFRDGEVELDSLLNDEGDVDAGKVAIVAAEVVERQPPHWKRRETTASGGADGGKGADTKEDEPLSFGEALKSA